MPSTQHDLSITSYGLIALLVVGHATMGLRTTLILAITLLGASLAFSLLWALGRHVLRRGKNFRPHLDEWGGRN